jgi:hypothetical protein
MQQQQPASGGGMMSGIGGMLMQGMVMGMFELLRFVCLLFLNQCTVRLSRLFCCSSLYVGAVDEQLF